MVGDSGLGITGRPSELSVGELSMVCKYITRHNISFYVK